MKKELPIDCPTYADLMDHAEAGFVKRALARYFIPRDCDATIARYRRIGIPLVRKLVMNTTGRISRPFGGTNYRLGKNHNKLQSANNFALKSSVFNETVHIAAAGLPINNLIHEAMNDSFDLTSFPEMLNFSAIALNFSLIALQRYNRARTIKVIERGLAQGRVFNNGYKNWAGIDDRAVENYVVHELTAKLEESPYVPAEFTESPES